MDDKFKKINKSHKRTLNYSITLFCFNVLFDWIKGS